MYDLMIIGGGPAGLSAAVYAARKRINTLLITDDIGGQPNTTTGIENYLGYQFISGPELVERFHAQVSQFPIVQKTDVKVSKLNAIKDGFEAATADGSRYQAKTVILATGKIPRKLDIQGEKTLLGKGISYCAVCDGPIFAGQKVAVIGGGNSAITAVLDMAPIAQHIYLVSLTELTADPVLTEKFNETKNLTTYINHQVLRITGDDFVRGIALKDLAKREEKTIDVSGIFIEIGLEPNSEPVKHLLVLNKLGEIPISCYCETTVPGLFAAGDVTDVPDKQIIIAAGEGAKAALQAHRYLRGIVD